MIAVAELAGRALRCLVRADGGLVRIERALLAGTLAMVLITILFLLGVDIAAWFGVEQPAE